LDFWQNIYQAVNGIEVTTVGSIYKLLLSMVLGAVVGFERKRKGQSAGVRTFSLIAMGATLAMLLSIYVPQEYMGLKNGDPGRIAAQVVTGIGFLGAGAIIQMKGSVRGLTTAAGIWMVATIGMAVGVGLYWLSVVATMLILFILVQLESIEHRMSAGSGYRKVLKNHRIHLSNFYVEYNYETNTTSLNLVILAHASIDYIKLFDELSREHPTQAITLANQLSI